MESERCSHKAGAAGAHPLLCFAEGAWAEPEWSTAPPPLAQAFLSQCRPLATLLGVLAQPSSLRHGREDPWRTPSLSLPFIGFEAQQAAL